ncbi:MAG: P-loop NTPase, partial [Chloroflexi bacterium]|nr:P-loop NTPase [Chloroflexota bacterium]
MTEKRQPRTPTPQERARLDAMKRNWEQRRQVSERLSSVKTKLGVYSGKGGVGKTTVAVNLAVTLAHRGLSVG